MSAKLEDLAEWAVSLRYEQIPASVVDCARQQLVSVLSSLYSGASCVPGRACRTAALALATSGNATILPTGEQASPHAAVLANAAFSMAHDFDDYLFLGHTGHSAVLATLAVGEQVGATLEEVLTAQVVANEVAGRLGAYVVIGPQNGQLWAHIHIAAAVVGAARLLGLTAAVTADALAIGFYLPPFALFPGFFASDAKLLTAALPAANGLYATSLASAGLRGARDILDRRHGFAEQFAFVPLPELLSGLGKSWVSDSMSCKIYPGCAYVDGPVDAALTALGARQLESRDIAAIDIVATAMTTGMERVGAAAGLADLDPIAVNFSARRSVATALLAGALTPRELEPGWLRLHGGEVMELVAKTRLRESRAMTIAMLRGLGRAIDLPALTRSVGVARLWAARAAIRRTYAAANSAGKRTWPTLLRRRQGARAMGSIGALSGFLRDLGTSKQAFSMADARFDELEFRFAAAVKITLTSGEKLRASQTIPFGAAGRAAAETSELVADKLRNEARAAGYPAAPAAIEALLARDPAQVEARALTRAVCARSHLAVHDET